MEILSGGNMACIRRLQVSAGARALAGFNLPPGMDVQNASERGAQSHDDAA
jgi:hypothetical protein